MKNIFGAVILSAMLIAAISVAIQDVPEAQAAAKYKYVPAELIVKNKPGIIPSGVFEFNTGTRKKILKKYNHRPIAGFADLYVYKFEDPAMDVNAYATQLAQNTDVVYAHPNFKYKVSAYANPDDDTYFNPGSIAINGLWGLNNVGVNIGTLVASGIKGADIDIIKAWGSPLSLNQNSEVCLIDTGIKGDHTDLSANISASGHYGNSPLTDSNGHGTHIAGIIAAIDNNIGVIGVNPYASLVSIKAFNAVGESDSETILPAVQHAVNVGCKIVSMAFEQDIEASPSSITQTGADKSLFEVIEGAKLTTLFIASAGNGLPTGSEAITTHVGMDIDAFPINPASLLLDNLITVTATDNRDMMPVWANYGVTKVHLAAPGVDIWSTTTPNGGPAYKILPGTSQAAAYVSGVVSLLSGSYTPAEIKQRLMNSVDIVPGLAGKVASGGRLNADKFIHGSNQISPATHYGL